MDFILKNLIANVTSSKPDDPLTYAIQFMNRIQSCQHVLGMCVFIYICFMSSYMFRSRSC